ncbi:MAG: basic secretory protein-like protein [Verrucomicrobiota bacterium]
MKAPRLALLAATTLAAFAPPACFALAKVEIDRIGDNGHFKSGDIPSPSINDAATNATFILTSGERSRNGADLKALQDGKIPTSSDAPQSNFFFQDGSSGGRIAVDLGKAITVKSIQTYSWHTGLRSSQVYKLYAATGEEKGFQAAPTAEIDPRAVGWKPIAKVDTRRKDEAGQHLASVSGPRGENLGKYRHVLFEFERTDAENGQSNTFLSEIDIIDADGPTPQSVPEPTLRTYPGPDGKHTYVLDATLAPDLVKWVEKELMPVVYEWYPKMSAMLPSDGYTAPEKVIMEFRDDMGGTPAYAAGNKLSMSVPWFRSQLEGEAKGCVIHELVHIIQNYWRAAATNPNPTRTPGWVTEGIPDYLRWFAYEPEKKGAEITAGNFADARHDSSYRISANFLNWVVLNHDKEFIRKLNAAAREGRYSEQLWKDATGKSLDELSASWKMDNAKRLGL